MADATAAPPAAAAPEGGRKTGLLVALTLGGVVLGGLVGGWVVAPRLLGSGPPAVAGSDTAGAGHDAASGAEAGEGAGEHGEGGAENRFVELNNIIVNPAGSQGTRFLMISVALSVPGAEAQQRLQAGEIQLRDRITAILERMTLAQLTATGVRDTLKGRIAAAASEFMGPRVPVVVFLPQFVIQ